MMMKKTGFWKRFFCPVLLVSLLFTAGAAFAAGNGIKVSLKATAKVEKSEDRTEDIKESANGNESVTTTDSETEVCTVTVKIKSRSAQSATCQLEWYFLSEIPKSAKTKSETVLFSPGEKELSLEASSSSLEETITSPPFVLTTVTKGGKSDDKISGDTYKGYIVLVTKDGEILAKASNSARYLKDKWIRKTQAE
jgi:hypothetical protein